MDIKVKVQKFGELSDYINKPVLDRTNISWTMTSSGRISDGAKVIGVIKEAIENANNYELTLNIFNKDLLPNLQFDNNKLTAISIEL